MTLALHNLNSEGVEGNQQQTRMVHVVDPNGKRSYVNAVSGDMFKHFYVRNLTAILRSQGQPLSTGAFSGSPDRITVDEAFKKAIKGPQCSRRADGDADALRRDGHCRHFIHRRRHRPQKIVRGVRLLVGIPEKVHTEQYFHVKYDPDRRKGSTAAPRGEGSIAGTQTVFHRPASSGVYALVCNLELSRIGLNDVTREAVVAEGPRRLRQQAAVQALLATLIRPAGAQSNTQNAHILACSGVVTYVPVISAGARTQPAGGRLPQQHCGDCGNAEPADPWCGGSPRVRQPAGRGGLSGEGFRGVVMPEETNSAPGRWLIFTYAPAALFALKYSRATSTAGKTLLTPTPYAIKMAFVDAGLRHRLVGDFDAFVRWLAGVTLRIGVPQHACVTGTIQSIRQEIRDERKRQSACHPIGPTSPCAKWSIFRAPFGLRSYGDVREGTDFAAGVRGSGNQLFRQAGKLYAISGHSLAGGAGQVIHATCQ